MAIRVGIGGWTYAPWRGAFYPPGLPRARELAYAAERLTAIEINGTFYRTPTRSSVEAWATAVPAQFVFSLKAPRYASWRRTLADAGPAVTRFVESGIGALGDRLGPVLWQLAPTRRFDPADLDAFLQLLPTTVEGQPLRHAIELRHPSFIDPAYIELLRRYRIASVIVDSDRHPPIEDVTADFVYLRLERSAPEEPTGYPAPALDRWARRLRAWADGGEPDDATRIHDRPARKARRRDVFAFFIGGAKARNPAAAMALIARLDGRPAPDGEPAGRAGPGAPPARRGRLPATRGRRTR